MIYITGDTHGTINLDSLTNYFIQTYVSRKDYLIILGDAGIVWDKNYKDTVELYEKLGLTIFYIDGNHENFDILNCFDVIYKNNAKVHKISEHVFHVLRGEILELNGLSFLCMGGAESIDKEYRKSGVTWWRQERITNEDVSNALLNLKTHDMKVDYVLSHCAPDTICVKKFGFHSDESTRQLNRLCYYVKTTYWYFGHYHFDETIDETFVCFYNDVLKIDKRDSGTRKISYKLLTKSSWYDDYKNNPFLINWNTGRKTKLLEEDLPEWFYHNFSYRDWYYCVKNVKDIAYKGSPFDNHINKDSSIFLSYDKQIEKNDNYEPLNGYYSNHIHTWRCDVVDFTYALEKYSPNLDLTNLKAHINLTYDQYNRNEDNWRNMIYPRPFPEVETIRNKDINYSVIEDYDTLCEFYELENAKKFCEYYLKNNLKISKYEFIENKKRFIYAYFDSNRLIKKIVIKKV